MPTAQRILRIAFLALLALGAAASWLWRSDPEAVIVWRRTTDQRFIFGRHHLFHRATCPALEDGDVLVLDSVDAARADGLRPCMFCLPSFDPYRVTRVIDGNTLEIQFYQERRRVQLAGVDVAPFDGSPENRRLANEASALLKEKVGDRTIQLRLEYPDYMDRYDRMLGQAFLLTDGTPGEHLNLTLLRSGLAGNRLRKDSVWHPAFAAAESEAKNRGLGMWAERPLSPGE